MAIYDIAGKPIAGLIAMALLTGYTRQVNFQEIDFFVDSTTEAL